MTPSTNNNRNILFRYLSCGFWLRITFAWSTQCYTILWTCTLLRCLDLLFAAIQFYCLIWIRINCELLFGYFFVGCYSHSWTLYLRWKFSLDIRAGARDLLVFLSARNKFLFYDSTNSVWFINSNENAMFMPKSIYKFNKKKSINQTNEMIFFSFSFFQFMHRIFISHTENFHRKSQQFTFCLVWINNNKIKKFFK